MALDPVAHASPSWRSCASSPATRTAPSASPGRTRGSRRAPCCAASSRAPARSRRSTRRATSGSRSAARRPGAPDRRAHRLGAERRLARRLPERRSPAPRCCGGSRRRASRRSRCGSSTGPTRRARASAARSSARRPRPARCATRTSCASSPTATASRCRTRSREHGVDLDRALDARSQLEDAAAYLELHIEQGPVLESMDLPLGVVLGTFGVERSRITWRGQAAHAGSTPMDKRRDALAGAAKLALEHPRDRRARSATARSAPRRRRHASRASSPRSSRRPSSCSTSATSTPTSLARHARSWRRRRAERFAAEENIEVEWERIWSIEPILFDETLIGLADEAIREVVGHLAPAAVGPLARRRRGLARGHPDGDGVRAEPARPLAHEARGHEDRASRAERRGPRPARVEDARGSRSPTSPYTRSERCFSTRRLSRV